MKTKCRVFLKMAGMAGLSLSAANALYTKRLVKESSFKELPKQIEDF
jgi:hypothetical protein